MTSLDHKTKDFLEKIDLLIKRGVIKNHAEVVKTLAWNKSVMSSVKKGSFPVPQHIYNKFKDVYKDELVALTIEEGQGDNFEQKYKSLLEDYVQKDKEIRSKDEQVALLRQIVVSNADNIKSVLERLHAVEQKLLFVAAFQKVYQEFYADHIPPPGWTPDNMKSEIWNRAMQQMVQFQQEGIE